MKWITENWKLKIASIVIAIASWAYVRDIKMDTINISVPVAYEKLPDKYTWKSDPPRYIELRVRGRKEDLQFPTGNLKSFVNMSNASTGKRSYRVRFDPNLIPEKIEIVSIPSSVKVQLEDVVRKKVIIIPLVVGEPAQGFKQGVLSVTPKMVTIESSRSKLKSIDSLSTDPINITNAQKAVTIKINISAPKNVRIVDTTVAEVRIPINPESNSPDRFISGIQIEVENLDPALRVLLSSPEIKIHISGDPKVISKLNSSHFQAYINLEGTRYNPKTGSILPFETESEIPIKVRILVRDKSIKIMEILPGNLTVRFSVKPEFLKKPEDEKPSETTEGGDQNEN